MSNIRPATCTGGTVTSEGVPVDVAEILSQGTKESAGVIIIQGDKVWYVTSNATDIADTITKITEAIEPLADALSKIATSLTSIGAGMTGPTTTPPPTLGTDVTFINAKVNVLNQVKSALESLKEELK